ncbi:hypothetical protein FDP41_003468 [Naegleria fowleri]|uniref:Uncharacterized protein n=1 Tax=Naegleria fowleri TaxID=5763 RepID=A0A6A5BQW4_NAEFO|nr:uncharacterized protein FDP41_003468 [Naegleria fowleri]KAF0977476.1 hypothetical protein FDP41_003468 [Naegleria fowleri]
MAKLLFKPDVTFKKALKNFSEAILPLFDLNHEKHIVLVTEVKGVLKDLFLTFIKTRDVGSDSYDFHSNFCPVKREEKNPSVLKIPTEEHYPDIASLVGARIISNSDSIT